RRDTTASSSGQGPSTGGTEIHSLILVCSGCFSDSCATRPASNQDGVLADSCRTSTSPGGATAPGTSGAARRKQTSSRASPHWPRHQSKQLRLAILSSRQALQRVRNWGVHPVRTSEQPWAKKLQPATKRGASTFLRASATVAASASWRTWPTSP